jgi:hypothetical protein
MAEPCRSALLTSNDRFEPTLSRLTADGLDALGERIASLSALVEAATYQLLTMLRRFDEEGGWNRGFRSCAHWLNWRTGLELGAAREKVRVARALGSLPLLSAAMARGELSFSKVRALTRVATPANEAELLGFAKAGTASHVERLVRAWRRVDRLAEMEEEQRRHASRYLRAYTDEDGMVVVAARLAPEAGAALLRALDAAAVQLFGTQPSTADAQAEITAEQRRADCLGLVAESALAGGLDPGTRGDRFQVVVHVDADGLAGDAPSDVAAETSRESRDASPRFARRRAGASTETTAGPASAWSLTGDVHVSAATSRRLTCDCAVVEMHHNRCGATLDVGRRRRVISPALRRALQHRDRGCRFPGCGLTLCDGHHVEHWADGGRTNLDNMLLLCRRHHRAVHEEGFRVELGLDGTPRFFRPDGRPVPEAPPLAATAGDAPREIGQLLACRGITVDPAASLPTWDGGVVEYGWAIDAWRVPPAALHRESVATAT